MILEALSLVHLSSYAIRPAKLFNGVEQRLVVLLGSGSGDHAKRVYSSRYNQWFAAERAHLFPTLEYGDVTALADESNIPKPYGQRGVAILEKIRTKSGIVAGGLLTARGSHPMYFHRTPGYWVRFMDFEPYFRSPTATRSIHHIRILHALSAKAQGFVGAAMSSSTFFYWFFATGNCRNLTLDDVRSFPIGSVPPDLLSESSNLFRQLMANYQKNSQVKRRGEAEFQEFRWFLAKHVVDAIDTQLQHHYDFTDEELDLIVNHDIKIRCGENPSADESEA